MMYVGVKAADSVSKVVNLNSLFRSFEEARETTFFMDSQEMIKC